MEVIPNADKTRKSFNYGTVLSVRITRNKSDPGMVSLAESLASSELLGRVSSYCTEFSIVVKFIDKLNPLASKATVISLPPLSALNFVLLLFLYPLPSAANDWTVVGASGLGLYGKVSC